jgi:hypothetical protein
MTTLATAKQRNSAALRARGVAGWIGLAASPTFALMALIAAADTPRMAMCASASAMPPIDGMAWMYLLMSVFHVSSWLKLGSGRPRQLNGPATQNCPLP